ncbi:HNH endonuclease [Streptomyces sp. NPDC088923]|uniref:HNH endonuclease n=1 Tax=Streptomyces sp. NPDC088923 TaxID=3365913 RepID=UPI0038147146
MSRQSGRHTDMPDKWTIARYWAGSPERERFAPWLVPDSPCCFACGWFGEKWEKAATAKGRWGAARLDRAHIVPDSLGGPATADNLLLLCKRCHEDSPDWPDREEMARWIARREERPSREMETFMAWFAAAEEVPEFKETLASLFERYGEDEATRRVKDIMRAQFDQAGTHFGIGISPGTRVAILRSAAVRALDGPGSSALATEQ